jgi:Xaa-Pro aminopeptidase
MFQPQTYIERRKTLKEQFKSGILLFLGNNEAPSNYSANTFEFRQDSTFLYYFGIDLPGLAALIDVDSNTSLLYGTELTVDDIVWMGQQPGLNELAEKSGIDRTEDFDNLENVLTDAVKKRRKVHFLPQYRGDQFLLVGKLLGIQPTRVNDYVSPDFIKAVVSQRSIKSEEEIAEIDKAVDIAYRMHTAAMKMIKPGLTERKIAGMIEGIAFSLGGGLSFRPIVSINGHILHNPHHGNEIKDGSLLVNDSGAETDMHYASDITRTLPASGKFTSKQREIYEIVLNAETSAINESKPGVMNKDLHLLAATIIVEGLSNLGLMQGSVDEAVQQGAHALFFPHGLGHMLGLDVHDLEGLGEDYVGYTDEITRSDQFGLAYLRLAKSLEPGHVFTIEPGIYFIPALIDQWKSENKFSEFINYDKVEDYRNFGGIRIEDDILVTEDGYRILGKPIPKTVDEVEAITSTK